MLRTWTWAAGPIGRAAGTSSAGAGTGTVTWDDSSERDEYELLLGRTRCSVRRTGLGSRATSALFARCGEIATVPGRAALGSPQGPTRTNATRRGAGTRCSG